MAKPASAVESHPQRQKVVDALLAGQTYKQITSWLSPPLSQSAISRFKSEAVAKMRASIVAARQVIANNDTELGDIATESQGVAKNPAKSGDESQKAVYRAALTAACDPFVQRTLKADERRSRWMDTAEKAGDLRTCATLDRNDLVAMEYHAKLSGRLEAAHSTTINVGQMLVLPQSHEMPQLPPAGEVIDVDPE